MDGILDGKQIRQLMKDYFMLSLTLEAGVHQAANSILFTESQNFLKFCHSMNKMELAASCMVVICRAR